MNLQAAIQFVQSHGDPAEQARLRFLTIHAPAPLEIRQAFFADQRPDGGFTPVWAAYYSSLDASCFRLAQARQMGLDSSLPEVSAALRFLAERQASRGSWEEDAAVAGTAPPWAVPGEEASQLYLTANCGYTLAQMGYERAPAELAAAFLRDNLEPSGKLPSFLHAHWLAGGLWVKLGWDREAEVVLTYLTTRLPELALSACAWMITTLREAGLPADHTLILQAIPKIQDGQQSDGRWVSEDGSARDVNATLDALHALKLCESRGQ